MIKQLKFWWVQYQLSRMKTPRDAVRMAFKRFALRLAFVDQRRSLTYAALGVRVFRMAGAWRSLGLRPGDVVMVDLPEGICLLEARLAAAECGVVLAGVSPWSTSELLRATLPTIEPKMLIHDGSKPEFLQLLSEIFPDLLKLVLHDGDPDWLARGQAQPCPGELDPQALMALGFSSGTTGTPKIITATFGVYVTSIRLMVNNVGLNSTNTTQDVMLVGIPLVGAGSGVVLPTLMGGGTLVVPQAYDADHLLEAVEKFRATRLFITPSLLIDILDHPRVDQYDLSSLRNIIYGTETLAAAKVAEAIKRFGPILQQGYGSAEVLPPVSMLQPGDHMINGEIAPRHVLMSCGRVVPEATVRIVNDAGQDMPVGQPGEVLVKSPTLFRGYWKAPELTHASLRNGFLHIGDMGMIDAQGYLTVLGRKPDLLQRQGRTIFPRFTEEALHEHPAIKEANYVQGEGETVMVYSLRRAYRDTRSAQDWASEFQQHLKGRVPHGDLPDRFVLMTELPRSPLGKVLRRGVREHIVQADSAAVASAAPSPLKS